MAQKILLKKSTVAGKVPVASDLDIGELAVNTADPALYTKHSDGTIKKLTQSGQSISGIIKLIYNDETDSSEYASSTNESSALKSFTLPANQYSKIIIEFIAASRVEQDATTKCDFTYRVKVAGNAVRTFINRITANSSTGADSGDRITSTLSHILNGGQTIDTDLTITVQHSLSNANTATTIKAFRVYGLITGAILKGDPGSIEADSDVIFSEATTKTNINSGDSISSLFGKLKKWYNSFGTLAWKTKASFADDIDNKPTTLAGYGITDSYTKQEVDQKVITQSVVSLTSLSNLPIDKSHITVKISASETITFISTPPAGFRQTLYIMPTSSATMQISTPNGENVINSSSSNQAFVDISSWQRVVLEVLYNGTSYTFIQVVKY